jgi:hypothetical protein
LRTNYRRIKRFLPTLLEHIHFGASPAGKAVVQALDWLRDNMANATSGKGAPLEVIRKPWQRHVLGEGNKVDLRAYSFCVLDELRSALRHREVFVTPSWRYADPRAGLLVGAEWEAARPIVCRTLGLSATPQPTLSTLTEALDRTYRQVAARLPENPAVRLEAVGDKKEMVLSPLDKLEEPASLLALRSAVGERLPARVSPSTSRTSANGQPEPTTFLSVSARSCWPKLPTPAPNLRFATTWRRSRETGSLGYRRITSATRP